VGGYRGQSGVEHQETSVATNVGAGANIDLAGPLRLRLDYRLFMLQGSPLCRKPQLSDRAAPKRGRMPGRPTARGAHDDALVDGSARRRTASRDGAGSATAAPWQGRFPVPA